MFEVFSNFSFFTDIVNSLKILFKMIGSGIGNFIDLVIHFPSFFYHLVDFVPMPLQGLLIVFLGTLIFVIFLKVVSYFV